MRGWIGRIVGTVFVVGWMAFYGYIVFDVYTTKGSPAADGWVGFYVFISMVATAMVVAIWTADICI